MASLFNFMKASLFNLKNAPARKEALSCVAEATLWIGVPLLAVYHTIAATTLEGNGVSSPDGYPTWKESGVRKVLSELITGRAAKE